METLELPTQKADNLAYTINEILRQIKRKGPLPLYERGDRFNFDFYGIIERVWQRIGDSFNSDTRVGQLLLRWDPNSDGLVYDDDKTRNFNHEPLLRLLEETLILLNEGGVKSMIELRWRYTSLRNRLLELRYN